MVTVVTMVTIDLKYLTMNKFTDVTIFILIKKIITMVTNTGNCVTVFVTRKEVVTLLVTPILLTVNVLNQCFICNRFFEIVVKQGCRTKHVK